MDCEHMTPGLRKRLDNNGSRRGTVLLIAAFCLGLGSISTKAEESKELRVFNWSDYIGETTVEDFQDETEIVVSYEVFDSQETLEAKLEGGEIFDVVVPNGSSLGRHIRAGLYQKIDRARLSNYENLDPRILEGMKSFDPTNEYGVPYFWGTVGIGYNVQMVKERLGENAPTDSFDLVFQPEYAAKLADCGIAMIDSDYDVLQPTLNYLGRNPYSESPEDYKAAEELLMAIRPYVRYFNSTQYLSDLADGTICVAVGWSGDVFIAAARAAEEQTGIEVRYSIPKEGTLLWVDSLAIPANARNVDNAHLFIDYLLDPEVAADGINYVQYASANAAAKDLADDEVVNNPAIYPTDEIMQRLFPETLPTAEQERLLQLTWRAFKQ